jgi:hypothetical protein
MVLLLVFFFQFHVYFNSTLLWAVDSSCDHILVGMFSFEVIISATDLHEKSLAVVICQMTSYSFILNFLLSSDNFVCN